MTTKRKLRQKPTLRDKRSATSSKRKASDDKNLPALPKPQTNKEVVIRALGKDGEKRLRMTKRKIKELAEIGGEFKHALPNIFDLLDQHNDPKAVQAAFLKASLATIIDLIPFLEERARKGQREQEMYALNSLISQGREILHDLQGLQDSNQIIYRVTNDVINPAYMAIAHTFISLLSHTRNEIEELVKDTHKPRVREIFEKAGESYGEFLNTSRETVKTRIIGELQ